MLTSFIRTKRAGIRVALIFSLCLGLIFLASMIFPGGSRAKLQPSPQSVTSTKRRRPQFVPGQVLVRYRSESAAAINARSHMLIARDGTPLQINVERFDGSNLVSGLRLAHVTGDTLKAVEALRGQPDVLYAEPDYILKADLIPNDTQFLAGRQPNISTIGAPVAWNTNTGSNSVVVGVIDQGIDTGHLDLAANIWTNPAPGSVSGITGDLHGYNFVNNNGTVFSGADSETHATHVAGILGAVGNNNKGIAGVSWSVGLMSLKFLDATGNGTTSDAIRACNYAKAMRDLWETAPVHTKGANIRILNASFGGAGFSQSFIDSLTMLNASGILFVAAAGNIDDGTREPNNDLVPHYPSSFNVPNVIAVASTDPSDVFSSTFSHFGATSVDLAAPGEHILSTTPHCANPGQDCQPSFTDPNGDTYSFFSGTSMSTPHVSGAAALLWSQNPNLTVQQVKNLLMLDGDIQPSLIDKTLTGRRLDVGNSFQTLAENDSVAPGAVTNFHINSQNGRALNVGWTASGDDGVGGQASLYQLNFIDGGSGAVIPLKGLIPMPSGSGQIADVRIPFKHTTGTLQLREVDNAGNEGTPVSLPVGVPLSSGDPYTFAEANPAPLSTGGTLVAGLNDGTKGDDNYADFLLPTGFTFPFFGGAFTTVTVSTNGALYFSDPPLRNNGDADDVPSSPGTLGGYKMIAGLWDDLDLRVASRADAGVFFSQPNSNTVIFRWQGVPCNFDGNVCTGGDPVNFEIELHNDGVIITRYGSGNTTLFPTVGIGGGEQDGYAVQSHTSEETQISLTNANQVTFTPRTQTASSVQFSQPTFGITEGTSTLNVGVTRTGDTSSVATVNYATTDTAGANNCTVNNGAASSRCDYLTTIGTLTFAAGETAKTIPIPIIDDVYAEGPETFSIGLSNATGTTLGAPSTATVTITDNEAANGTNPIDTAGFFVRQHYVDFLNREPDTGGLNFWTNEITSCGADVNCIEVKRINVSAAFFLSIEFQETGYLVYRVYKAGLGNLPGAPVPVGFQSFLRDTQQIGQGVQVGIGDWQAKLEANKQAYALAFVQRADFQAAFPNTQTADAFVTKLDTNAGGVLSAAEKSNLVAVLGTTPSDLSKRASVLRSVAEDADLRTAEFNKAFVLMQYFGYLRRNPNDAPDADFGGYNFWLNKLNSFGGNFVNAEMVKAFILSGEYRQRFGP